ncbi:glutaredoxin family protein [Colwelliaceae bacterium BS250]
MTTLLAQVKKLALYHYESCPYCAKTRSAIKALGQSIELRNIQLQPENRTELLQGGGKAQVPCLRIDTDQGESQWLYESDDIINFVAQQQNELFRLALTA